MILKPSNCSNSSIILHLPNISQINNFLCLMYLKQPSSLNLKVTPSVLFPSPTLMQPPHSFLYNPCIAQTNAQTSLPMSISDTLFHHHQAINIIHQFILFLLMYMHNLLSLIVFRFKSPKQLISPTLKLTFHAPNILDTLTSQVHKISHSSTHSTPGHYPPQHLSNLMLLQCCISSLQIQKFTLMNQGQMRLRRLKPIKQMLMKQLRSWYWWSYRPHCQ